MLSQRIEIEDAVYNESIKAFSVNFKYVNGVCEINITMEEFYQVFIHSNIYDFFEPLVEKNMDSIFIQGLLHRTDKLFNKLPSIEKAEEVLMFIKHIHCNNNEAEFIDEIKPVLQSYIKIIINQKIA